MYSGDSRSSGSRVFGDLERTNVHEKQDRFEPMNDQFIWNDYLRTETSKQEHKKSPSLENEGEKTNIQTRHLNRV